MSIAVLGCGRSGSNMLLEIIRGSHGVRASQPAENRKLFTKLKTHANNYITKCDTCRFDFGDLYMLLERNPNMKVVWTIRDPRDMAMSKLRRGAPWVMGGDCRNWADDASPRECVMDIYKAAGLYVAAKKFYRGRIWLAKMEEFLEDLTGKTMELCRWAEIEYHDDMLRFYDRMRVNMKKDRYKGVDKSQIGLWKHWREYEDGFLATNDFDMIGIFSQLQQLTEYFGYA